MEQNILTLYLMPVSLAIIMLGMGMSLLVDNFKQVLDFPKAFMIGCVNQMVLVPCLALLIVYTLDLSPMLAAGLMLIAACPGGPATNLITFLSNGNLALSITLTSIDGLITMFSLPLIISLSIAHFLPNSEGIEISVVDTMLKIFLMTLLPVSIGMLIRQYKEGLALKLMKYVKPISALMYLLILISIFLSSFDLIIGSIKQLGIASVLLNVGGMTIGWTLATIFQLKIKDKIAIIIESGIQNGSLAIVLASSVLMMPELSLIAGIYSVWMFFTSGIVVLYFGKYRKTVESTQ